MRSLVQVLVVLLILADGTGMALVVVAKTREAAARMECCNHLRLVGMELAYYPDTYGRFPSGTLSNESLPPERRLSWYVDAWGFVGDGQCGLLLDKTKAWDSEENRVPMMRCSLPTGDGWEDVPVGEPPSWRCPSNPQRATDGMPGLTHYVGVAGVGSDAAILPLYDVRIGVFGYDRSARTQDIKDGFSTTMLLVETASDNGPWTAGGPATVRGLDPSRQPYLGPGRQFGGTHPGVVGAVFADGSAHFIRQTIAPEWFEALATIAGQEPVGAFADE
jgi:hypothetical protein